MEPSFKDIFGENLRWLCENADDHNAVINGVICSLAKSLQLKYTRLTPEIAKQSFDELCGQPVNISYFALLCKYLWDLDACEIDKTPAATPKKVVYMRSSASDKAYATFSELYPGLKAAYAQDFKTVCEDVYYERVDACLLPMLGSSDGLFSSFRQMMLKYELKIASAYTFYMPDDEFQTMALLTGDRVDPSGDMAEFCIYSADSASLADAFAVANVFGSNVERVTSVPSKYGTGFDHHICLSEGSSSLAAVKFCFDALFPSNILLGQYKNYYSERNIH